MAVNIERDTGPRRRLRIRIDLYDSQKQQYFGFKGQAITLRVATLVEQAALFRGLRKFCEERSWLNDMPDTRADAEKSA